MQGINVFTLGRKLDTTAARHLARDLLALRGQPLEISGEAVESAGSLALEVLVATGLQWQADGVAIQFSASPRLAEACRILGLDPSAPWQAQQEDAA